jgi:hypothetical protein
VTIERVTEQTDTFPYVVYFLYIYTVATYSIVHAYFVGSFPSLNLYLNCEAFPLFQYTVLHSEQHRVGFQIVAEIHRRLKE